MRVRRSGRPEHDSIIEIEKDFRRLFPDPIKFKRRQQSPLNGDHIEEGKLAIKDEPLLPRTGEGLPLWFYAVRDQIRKILFHPEPMTLVTRMGKEDDPHFVPFDFFSAMTKMDLAKSMPRY